MSAYQKLLQKVHEIYDLEKATRVLIWDRDVVMPQAGDTARIQQITTMQRLTHQIYTAAEMGDLLDTAVIELNGIDPESTQARLIHFIRRDYDNARSQSADLVTRTAAVSAQARSVWQEAREKDDFALFRPWLEQVVALEQERAELFGYQDEKYDALLDKYEPGMKTADVRALFQATKEAIVPLHEAIRSRGTAVDDSFLRQPYDLAQQDQFARYLATAVGYDFNRGHLGTAVHPFSTGFSRDDVRITVRFKPDFLNSGIFTTLHEVGHALYEQNTHPELTRTPLARDTSPGLDESQSRLLENIIGRSRGFWCAHLPHLQAHFPQQLGDYTLEQFYRGINKVEPGFIRLEADELTYNLHIILRFELEQAMLNGDLAIADLPTAWNDNMATLLGIVPPTDREGVLQDIHWTWPSFGYFPGYTLGNLYAAQFYEAAVAQEPAIASEMDRGEIGSLMAWLKENIHQHGRKFTPGEIVQRATGRPLGHEAFVRYATHKFSEIYNL